MPRRLAVARNAFAAILVVALWPAGPAALAADNGDRTLTFLNQCPGQTLRLGVNGGRVQDCGSNNACPAGTSCLIQDENGQPTPKGCYWDFPAGSRVMGPGASLTVQLDNPPIKSTVQTPTGPQTTLVKWSGNVYAGTHCDAQGGSCKTGTCFESVAGKLHIVPCKSGVGPTGPVTLAEFTLQPEASDFYDISIINGMNVPVSMVPVTFQVPGQQAGSDPYSCGAPGAASSPGLQGCPWSFNPNVEQLQVMPLVEPGGAACSNSSSSCGSGQVCGYAMDIGTTNVNQVCGKQIGWWTADELCAFTNNAFGAPINCSASVTSSYTNANLYACNGTGPGQSCYSTGASDTCCGCPDWKVGGVTLPLGPGYSCKSSNPNWTSVAEPWAQVLKQACSTAYSFPFDDATSTFTCSQPAKVSADTPNTQGYTITFCPGGKTGLAIPM